MKLISGNNCAGKNPKNGLCYDAAGNVVFDNQLGESGDRVYDAENRMTSAVGVKGSNSSYSYDADGRRTRRQADGQTFWQVYGLGGELVAEYQWNGTTATLQKEYGYRGGEMLIVADNLGTTRWLVTDHLGTPRMLADQTGSLAGITRHDYLPFGEENFAGSVRTGNGYQKDQVRQQFTGYEHDTETDLDFAEARYCSTKQGRFTSPDPYIGSASRLVPQSWNRYSYVMNKPLVYSDPSGMIWYRRSVGGSKYEYSWFDPGKEPGANSGWEKVVIGTLGLRIENVQGATGQFSKLNGHTITLHNDSKRAIEDNGIYRPLPPAGLAPIPLTQDAGFRVIATYALAAKYLIQNGGNPVGATEDLILDVVDVALGEEADDSAMVAMAAITKQDGKFTEPTLPGKTIVNQDGVTIEHYYRSDDHAPAHGHVSGEGPKTRIGANGNPLDGDPALSGAQRRVIEQNRSKVRSSINKIRRWLRFKKI